MNLTAQGRKDQHFRLMGKFHRPNQQVVLGLKEGDGPASAAKAGLASRTNTLLSIPMLMCMTAQGHGLPF